MRRKNTKKDEAMITVHHNEQNLRNFHFVHCSQQNFTTFAR